MECPKHQIQLSATLLLYPESHVYLKDLSKLTIWQRQLGSSKVEQELSFLALLCSFSCNPSHHSKGLINISRWRIFSISGMIRCHLPRHPETPTTLLIQRHQILRLQMQQVRLGGWIPAVTFEVITSTT